MIYLLTGNKQSGKTTRLSEWIKKQEKKISGILSPVKDGNRHFYSIATKTEFPFVIINNDFNKDEVLQIGKYTFYKKSFEMAVNEIEKGIKSNSEYVIIDEIGLLELQKKGFYNITKKCVDISRQKNNQYFIFVIRESLLDEIISFLQIKKSEFEIIKDIYSIRSLAL